MERRDIVSIFVAGFVGSALVVAIPPSATAQTEKLPIAKYAHAVCGSMSEIKRADDAIAIRFAGGPFAADFGPTQEAALGFVTGYQKLWADAASAFGKVSPQVSGGETISKAFVDYANKGVAEIQEAIDTFKAVDPNNRAAFTGALATFGYRGSVDIRPKAGDPLRAVTDRSVRTAFAQEKTCAGLFASLAGGPITEFPLPSRAFDITGGADGHLWFTFRSADKAGKIDARTGKVTEFPVPLSLQAITWGPDGNVWFTERDRTAVGVAAGRGAASTIPLHVGKIDPKSGKVTQFRIPGANPQPFSIAAGPDGNLWFSERGGNHMGRIDPATGTITLYPLLTPKAQPGNITAGPDGHLWFTQTGKIAKIDPRTGTVTEFSLPSAKARVLDITAGPDGNVWFTNTGENSIGKIDPATGVVTQFPVPTAAAGLFGITAGCDGNLWFAENNGSRVGKIEPVTGKITEFITPTANPQPTYIVTGPDGHLWFAEEVANQIGKLDLGAEKNEAKFKDCRKLPKV